MSDASLAAPVLLAFGASASWALANVAVQNSARLVGAFRGLLWAQVAGVVASAVLALVLDHRSAALSGAALAWLGGAGLASLLAYLSMFYALEHGRLAIAVPIMSGWAVISTAISVLVFREPVRPSQLGGAGLVIGGVILVSRYARQAAAREAAAGEAAALDQARPAAAAALAGADASSRRPRWLLASLSAAVGFGLLIPAIGRVTPAFGHLGAVAAVFVVDILLGLPLALVLRVDMRPPPRHALAPVVLAGLCEAAGFVCIALAVGRAPLAVVSPLASLASALTVIYAWVVLRDRPSRGALVGAAIVCAGVIALAL